jgi:hypothetical protein
MLFVNKRNERVPVTYNVVNASDVLDVDRCRFCVVGKAIRKKGPPRMPADFLWLVNESGVFEIGFDKLQNI